MKICYNFPLLRTISLFFSLLGLSAIPFFAQSQTLVWEEHFTDAAPNPNRWTYDFGNGSQRAAGWGWGNQELEYYTSRSENVRIENGILIIEARKENFDGSGFTSGRIKTEGRVHFQYGTVEARIKIPNLNNGLWPAFWTLGTVGTGWPSIGEIDILEAGSAAALAAGKGNSRVTSATHWSNTAGDHEYASDYEDAAVNLSEDYHLYKMVWTSQSIKTYIDNVEIYSFSLTGANAAQLTEFHKPHFLLLNLAVGGVYTGILGAGGITAPLPGKMYVDYIKLYQNPGDILKFSEDTDEEGNFGVLTETTPVTDSLTYGTNADLFYWNNLTNIANPAPVPFEGSHLLAVHANAGNWFGMGVSNQYVNLQNFATGSLKFHFKSSYTGQFKIGINTGHGETWMNFPAGVGKYGLIRDGAWHEVSIPMADFSNGALGMNIDLHSIKGAFMFAGDPAVGAADFYFDNIYYSGGISPNPSPTVSITAPANNSIFNTPANVEITANASDPNGSVAKVEFFDGNTLLATDTEAPYAYPWNGVAVGPHTLTAKATDNENAATISAPVVFYVSASGNTPPSATISSPANNAGFLTPNNVTITADATDDAPGIFIVEFYQGATLIGTDHSFPYSFTWVSPPAGNYSLTAKATDNGGLSTTSDAVAINVTNPIKPTVSITEPTANSSYLPGNNVTISATAVDANGTVTSVEFFANNVSVGSDNSAPFSISWNNVKQGSYLLTATATDNDGNTTTSAPVAIEVAPEACRGIAANEDYSYEVYTTGGKVYFTFKPLAPIAGSSMAILYLKEGNGGNAGYGMTADGANFIFNKTIANGTVLQFYFTYNTPPGGERSSNANPHTYVSGTVCITGAPDVNLTKPVAGESFIAPASITLEATASDVNGNISKVDFFNGADLIGTDNTAPYSFVWTNVPVGTYNLSAKSTDISNLSTTSPATSIIVKAPNANGYCGDAVNGDYEYKAVTNGASVTFTMHPLSPIAGSSYAIIYIREGAVGAYPGYNMTKVGNEFTFTKNIPDGTQVSYYFTYQTPPAGERSSVANKHTYTVGTNCVPGTLPVTLVTFNAVAGNNEQVNLSWTTASEQNSDYFLLEKGRDGMQFSEMTRVKSRGNSTGFQHYTSVDMKPVSGINYYRLSQVDMDGTVRVKGVRTATLTVEAGKIWVYPNPVHSNLINLSLGDTGAARLKVSLRNIEGKLLYQGSMIPTGGKMRINLANRLAPGLYLLSVEGYATLKVLVQ